MYKYLVAYTSNQTHITSELCQSSSNVVDETTFREISTFLEKTSRHKVHIINILYIGVW